MIWSGMKVAETKARARMGQGIMFVRHRHLHHAHQPEERYMLLAIANLHKLRGKIRSVSGVKEAYCWLERECKAIPADTDVSS